jgi:flagellar hook-associated protein 3 FlgL
MRVSTRSFYTGIQERILQLSDDLKKINEKISSGKNLSRPSDDPLSLIGAIDLRRSLSQIGQFRRNIERGESWLNLSESVLSKILQLVERAQEIAIQMASDTQNSQTRAVSANEVGHLLDQAISLGNSRLGGVYLFSGYRIYSPPFEKTIIGGVETAQYNGDDNDFKIMIGKEETLTVGKNGRVVLLESGIFDSLGRLKQALETNNLDGISEAIGRLKEVQDYLNKEISDVGGRAIRLEGKKEILDQLESDLQERLSNLEDADYTKVIIELRQKEIIYQAVLLSSTRIADLTILNYIR